MKRKKVIIDRWQRMYVGFTLKSAATRPRSLDILAYPSRMGTKLYYPDGEIRNVYKRPD